VVLSEEVTVAVAEEITEEEEEVTVVAMAALLLEAEDGRWSRLLVDMGIHLSKRSAAKKGRRMANLEVCRLQLHSRWSLLIASSR
jgi:hypothetical protein